MSSTRTTRKRKAEGSLSAAPSPVIVVERASAPDKFNRQLNLFLSGKINDLCRGLISAAYVRSQTKRQTDFLFTTLNDWGNAINFAICAEEGEALYIQVICARKGGAELLKYIIEFARKRGFKSVTLAALPHVVNFYKKYGFKTSQSCSVDVELERAEASLARDASGNLKKFASIQDTETDRKFMLYLSALIKKGLAADKKCKGVRDCNIEGYYMTLCL